MLASFSLFSPLVDDSRDIPPLWIPKSLDAPLKGEIVPIRAEFAVGPAG